MLEDFKAKIRPKIWVRKTGKNLGFREVALYVMPNMYSPNRIYLISPHDNSHFNKIVNMMKKFILPVLFRYVILSFFF